jgi:hypothetical protein
MEENLGWRIFLQNDLIIHNIRILWNRGLERSKQKLKYTLTTNDSLHPKFKSY